MTDCELLALFAQSPAQGQRALYDAYANYVYAIIFRILHSCGSREDVEDCLVETFTEVISHLPELDSTHLKAYIGQAARNRAANYYRTLTKRQQYTTPLETAPEQSVSHVQEDMEHRELQKLLLQSIAELGEPDATILIQKYYYGRRMKEIAHMVGLSPNAAQVRCSRALKRLRTALADWRDA